MRKNHADTKEINQSKVVTKRHLLSRQIHCWEFKGTQFCDKHVFCVELELDLGQWLNVCCVDIVDRIWGSISEWATQSGDWPSPELSSMIRYRFYGFKTKRPTAHAYAVQGLRFSLSFLRCCFADQPSMIRKIALCAIADSWKEPGILRKIWLNRRKNTNNRLDLKWRFGIWHIYLVRDQLSDLQLLQNHHYNAIRLISQVQNRSGIEAHMMQLECTGFVSGPTSTLNCCLGNHVDVWTTTNPSLRKNKALNKKTSRSIGTSWVGERVCVHHLRNEICKRVPLKMHHWHRMRHRKSIPIVHYATQSGSMKPNSIDLFVCFTLFSHGRCFDSKSPHQRSFETIQFFFFWLKWLHQIKVTEKPLNDTHAITNTDTHTHTAYVKTNSSIGGRFGK